MFMRHETMWPENRITSGGNPLYEAVGEISTVAPEPCLDFVVNLPSQTDAVSMASMAFQRWMDRDSLAASVWLASQPPGEIRQTATHQLVQSLSRGANPDYESAAHWALTLPHDGPGRGTTSLLFHQWLQRDREAAQAFIERPDFPPALRESLRIRPPKP